VQKFFLDYDIDRVDDLAIIDEAPLWSRKLLDICGGFGHLSFTDAWTLMLEYYLYHRCGLDRTIFLDQPIITRVLNDEIDKGPGRWYTSRAENFAFAKGNFYKTQVEHQALNIYAYIKMKEAATLPPPAARKIFSTDIPKMVPLPPPKKKPVMSYVTGPIRSVLGGTYRLLRRTISNKKS